jgi:hypothetical protein
MHELNRSSGISRRRFLYLLGAGAVAGAAGATGLALHTPAAAADAESGADLTGWTTVVGDGLYAAKGQAPVSAADITTEHRGTESRLRANLHNRAIMAHVLAYKPVTDPSMMTVTHRAGFSFRLPYLPSKAAGRHRNGQTIEGGLFVWDGSGTRVDHGTAFQWVLNPWEPLFGKLQVWTDRKGGSWATVGRLKPDKKWHTVNFLVDPVNQAVKLSIDGRGIPAPYSRTPKRGWGTNVSARLQAEAISLKPRSRATWAPQHEALIRDWHWTRQ